MRKTIFAALFILAFAASSYAESMWQPVLYAGGGAAIPTSKFKDTHKTGFDLGGGAGVIYNNMLEFSANAYYSRFPLDQSKFLTNFPSGSTVSGGASKILNIGGQVKYYIPTGSSSAMKLMPYIVGRLGAAHLTQSDLTVMTNGVSTTASSSGLTKFTYGVGIGTNIEVNPNLGLWVEGRFTGVSTPVAKTDYIPIQAGIRYVFGKE